MTKQEFDKVIRLVTTHTEHNGNYCDTGEDMEWACRSECIDMAVKRLTEAFNKSREASNA